MQQKFILLDRDGVINVDKGNINKKEDIELIYGSADAIKLLNENDYTTIVITNQAVVAYGSCTVDDVQDMHAHLNDILKTKGAHIDRFYFCPHHPTKGTNPLYTKPCGCRKPAPGMILQAQDDFKIEDLSLCYLIGDKTSDILAGSYVGCKTIMVKTGHAGLDGQHTILPMYRAENLYDAVRNIILR